MKNASPFDFGSLTVNILLDCQYMTNLNNFIIVCEKTIPINSIGPSARTFHCGVTFKEQLIVFAGGETGKNAVQDNNIYIFNPISKKWIVLSIQGPAPEPRHGHVMINFNDQFIYLHGGMSSAGIYADFWKLDLGKMAWINMELLGGQGPPGRAAHGGISIGKYLYLFGGLHENGTALDDLWKYDTGL